MFRRACIAATLVDQGYNATRGLPATHEGSAHALVGGHRRQRPGEGGHVAHRHQQGGVAAHLGEGAGVSGDDRDPGRHRLEGRQAEPLVPARVGEHERTGEQVAASGVVDVAGANDAVAVRRFGDGLVDTGGSPAVGARQHEHEVGIRAGDLVEGADEPDQVLARFERRQRQHVPLGTGARPAARRVATGDRLDVDPVRHDVDSVD